MKTINSVIAGLLAASVAGSALAAEGQVPKGIPHLDHLFVIMMENHTFQQVVGNPTMPFINKEIAEHKFGVAERYYAVGHPSLTNYLEVVGGSNFGVRSDNPPDWHNGNCQSNLQTGLPNADIDSLDGTAPIPIDAGEVICPISGIGKDADTPAIDTWNETSPPVINYLAEIDGIRSVPARHDIVGKTIADQLVRAGLSWKSYQENLPLQGADNVNISNGTATDQTTFNAKKPLSPNNLPPLNSDGVLHAYAVKHNPFAYFRSVQEGNFPGNSLQNIVPFDGANGLYADLANGHLPSLSYIVPNQCDDQHGQNNADAFCQEDLGVTVTVDNQPITGLTFGTQAGLNPGLSAQADATLHRLVHAIRDSAAWHEGFNAIVIVWDESDYSGFGAAPGFGPKPPANMAFPIQFQNRVVLTVETNDREARGVHSENFYDSFSLLKSMEAGFRLPCLNHACDEGVNVMSDLFGR